MKDYLGAMLERVSVLKNAIRRAERSMDRFPEGRLRVSQSRNQVRYYQVLPGGNMSGSYLTRDKRETIKALAQKDYTKQFIEASKKELSRLEHSLRILSDIDADMIYKKLSENRQPLVEPYILTDEIYAARWQEREFRKNCFHEEAKIYETRKGEKVRSKSEAILADILQEMGIPYHYEQALELGDNIVRYPDFTMLKVKSREEIYLEHFGLMDDERYVSNCLNKLVEYMNSGIYPAKNLLLTFESRSCPLDIGGTRRMLKDVFT